MTYRVARVFGFVRGSGFFHNTVELIRQIVEFLVHRFSCFVSGFGMRVVTEGLLCLRFKALLINRADWSGVPL